MLALAAVPALADMPKDIETIPFDELPEPLDGTLLESSAVLSLALLSSAAVSSVVLSAGRESPIVTYCCAT